MQSYSYHQKNYWKLSRWRFTRPHTTHGNQLLKMEASKTEKAVLAQYAGVQGAKPATVLHEISHNMLSSNFPGQLNSASTEVMVSVADNESKTTPSYFFSRLYEY